MPGHCSPHLTPRDFCAWGYVKDLLSQTADTSSTLPAHHRWYCFRTEQSRRETDAIRGLKTASPVQASAAHFRQQPALSSHVTSKRKLNMSTTLFLSKLLSPSIKITSFNPLNAHSPCEDKSDDVKDNFYEELRRVLFADFTAKVGRDNIFKLTCENESSHDVSYSNEVRVVNFATSKFLAVKSTMLPHRNIHQYTCTSPEGETRNPTWSRFDRQKTAFKYPWCPIF
jgi:hypothetical protein